MKTDKTKYEFMYDKCLILGNGFDLSLGLATSFQDFLNSEEWRTVKPIADEKHSLINYIKQNSSENWHDLEITLLQYAKHHKNVELKEELNNIKMEYSEIVSSLCDYLKRIIYNLRKCKDPKIFSDTFAFSFMRKYFVYSNNNPVYTFNYTPLDFFIQIITPSTFFHKYQYIHGSLENNIILGFECDDISMINKDLSFMIKTNSSSYIACDVTDAMFHANRVYIYGHSLNQIDSGYFQRFFSICAKEKKEKEITIITKDERSDVIIRDNIRNMGVSMIELLSNTHVEFLHTDYWKTKDKRKFEKLLNYL